LKTIYKTSEFLELRDKLSQNIALIPTMGSIHEGHISLIETAKKYAKIVVVTIFVNPIQFNSKDDYNSYPNTLEKDKEILIKNEIDILFCPLNSEIYPNDFNTYVHVNRFIKTLEGKYRNGHMEGVATIVTKLFNITRPEYAIFGEKDFQQLLLIKAFVRDLNMPVKIISSKTIRDKDGLALSSRNEKLSLEEKISSVEIIKSLKMAFQKITSGEKSSQKIIDLINVYLSKFELIKVEYVSIRHPQTFETINKIKEECVILIAVFVGNVRLIDNIIYDEKNG
jgi:pantoate--beta-alanine ligase